MNYDDLARQIYELSGPASNILASHNCMTRLRLHLLERPAGLAENISKLEGVLGVNDAGDEFQIILGPGRADEVGRAFAAILDQGLIHEATLSANDEAVPAEESASEASSLEQKENEPPQETRFGEAKAKELHAETRARNATPVKLLFRRISNIFLPLIPAFIACGLISGALNVAIRLDPLLAGSPIWQLLAVAGSTAFWGMNLFVGYNAAKEFGGTPILGGILGALISHPNLSTVVLNGYPLTPGRGGVIAVLLVAALGVWVEKRLRRCIPEILNLFVTPLITYLIAGSFAVLFLQPFGGLISDLIGTTATGAIKEGGALTGAILGGTFLPMVMMGVHQALTPIHAELLSRYGLTVLLPVLAMAGAGQVGASFAVYMRTKNRQLKKTVASALPVGIMGIGEPLIYGVTLPLGKPFLGACLGGACGGAIQASNVVGSATIGISGLPLAAATDQIGTYLLGLLAAYIGGFIATLIIGFDDPPEL